MLFWSLPDQKQLFVSIELTDLLKGVQYANNIVEHLYAILYGRSAEVIIKITQCSSKSFLEAHF
jgi:hypothetical protein